MLALFFFGKFLLHIPCWLTPPPPPHLGSFSYTNGTWFFIFFIFYLRRFSYTYHAGFIFLWGVSLTHPMLVFFFLFFLNLASFSYICYISAPASFLCGEFLLHIPCWVCIYEGSFSYTSRPAFIFMLGVSLTYPMLSWFLCRQFLLHIPWCFFFWGGGGKEGKGGGVLTHP